MCAEELKGLGNKSLLKQLNSMQHSNYCFNSDLHWIQENNNSKHQNKLKLLDP